MQIKEISNDDFTSFTKLKSYRGYYQSEYYGSLMSKSGYNAYYIGLFNDDNNLVVAALLLCSSIFSNFHCAYAPGGFVIDYNDEELVKIFIQKLKKFLYDRGFIYLKTDPTVIYQYHNENGSPNEEKRNNYAIIELFKTLGMSHNGFNLNFENLKPRWVMIKKIDGSPINMFNELDKDTKSKVNKAIKFGIKFIKGRKEDVPLFFEFVKKKYNKKLSYYEQLYDIFNGSGMGDIYLAKMNPGTYLEIAKNTFDEEKLVNDALNEKITSGENNESNINAKMESDLRLNEYKKGIIDATNINRKHQDGFVIGACLVIKYNNELFNVIDGINKDYRNYGVSEFMKWCLIEGYSKDVNYFNLGAISGDFNKDSKYYGLYHFKKGFNAEIVEYIGEFDLIINKQMYFLYKKFVKKFRDKKLKEKR